MPLGVLETLDELQYDTVVVSCFALKKSYRNKLRIIDESGVLLHFVDVQMTEEKLIERMKQRLEHYMSAEMVSCQFEVHELPMVGETDVCPVDTDCAVEDVLEEIQALL